MSEFLLGASYYPEWWSRNEWEKDFEMMAELGLNCVRMGEFAWSWYEPREGEFNFEPMLAAVDCAERHGIKVIMGTSTAVCPAWLYKKYPEVKGGNVHGHYDFGGRKGQCLSSEIFLHYAERITEEQTKALGGHPNIVGWQLDNEPGFPFSDFDACCRKGFQQWLKEKYGTIDELNKAWFTMMWSNVYNDFDEIDIPVNACEGGWTLEVQLDYRKYFSFTFNRLLRMEAGYVRKNSPGRFIYTNWPGANWSVNCFEGSEYLDFAGWDNYVGQPNGDNYRVQLRASMEHSFDRRLSNGKEKFLVAEQLGYTDANTPPEVIAAQTWLNVSHGAFATVFFEWRTPNGGAEQEYASVLGKDRQFRPETYPVIRKLSTQIKGIYDEIDGAKTPSELAALYSYENSWGTRGWVVDGPYDEEFFNAYGGFKNSLKTDVDVIGIDDDFGKYKAIVMPNHRITTPEQADRLKKYVENGGILIMNTDCGNRDEFNKMRDMLDPGLFAEICGAKVDSTISCDKLKKQTGEDCFVIFQNGKAKAGETVNRLVLDTAEPAAEYSCGLLSGKPAVTVNKFGKGCAVLFATVGNDVCFYEALADFVKDRFNIAPLLDADDGIIVSSRVKEDKTFIFAVNMKDKAGSVRLKKPMNDIISGREFVETASLEPYETIILT